MAQTPAVSSIGPVELVVESGQQITLPASLLVFEDGNITASGPEYTANKTDADKWLGYLVDQGLLKPAETPPPPQALLITAKNAGSTGNDIRIVVTNLRQDPADSTKRIFDATLTQVDTYADLTPDGVKGVLGSSASFTNGDRPGLVFVSSSSTPSLPKEGAYTPTSFVVAVPKDSGTGEAFKLTYRVQDSKATMNVQISDVSTDAGTFSLVATWSKAVTGIHVGELQTNFPDHVAVTAPGGGTPTEDPAPGTIVLVGGSDTATAQKASASVPASD
jgi:hypothetical protein